MADTRIWVPIIGTGDLPERDARRADVPIRMRYALDDGLPIDLTVERDAEACIRYAQVIVDEKDAERCPSRVPDAAVPESDQLMLRMIRECRDDWLGNADEFFDSIEDPAVGDREEMTREMILQAVARGLPPGDADRIRNRLGIREVRARIHGR